jgi:hypothetical protein
MLPIRLVLASIASALALTGCEAIGTIFEAGVWTGVIGIVVIVAIIVYFISRSRR